MKQEDATSFVTVGNTGSYQPQLQQPTKSQGGQAVITFHSFIASRGYDKPFDGYRSLFGFIWWFWIPRLHTQHPDEWNPRVIRIIWLCFAAGFEVWGSESKAVWPTKQEAKEAKP